MNTGTPKTTAREREIDMLNASVAKTQAALQMARLSVMQLEAKLVNKLAELRMQSLMLKRAKDFAARQQLLADAHTR